MLKKVEQEAADKLDATLFEQNLVFFSELEADFIKGLKKGITFFTWWGGEESDVVLTIIFHFDTFSFILSTTIS